MERQEFIEKFNKAPDMFFPIWAERVIRDCVKRLDGLYPNMPHGHYNCTSAMEEMAEFTTAVSQRMRGRTQDNYDILQEIGDVYVSVMCIAEVFGISVEDINRAINVKLERESGKQAG